MNQITFKFYSVLKNEDAMPFIGDDLLIAADGLGGSGSAVHEIDRTKHADIHGEILAGVFGDIPQMSPELSQYVEELIAPLTDEGDDTSALWASRIAIARCAYALTEGGFKGAKLDDEKVRAELAEFIAKGLHGAVEQFDLKNGKYDNQLLLPTTLAFIRFTEEKESVIAETVWAGDSRCYALLPSGLKVLSVDDEDGSGSITNLFYADNAKVRLNYLRHEIQKPCVLMAVSDGVFDPFAPHDHLGVEQTVLSTMAESGSEQELQEKLRGYFDRVHADDATMAFASFGFDGFADMKDAFKDRIGKILSVSQKQADMQSALEVLNLTEEEASHYILSRTTDRYDYLVPLLIDAIEQEKDDVAVTAEIRSIAENARKNCKAAAEKTKKERREKALNELTDYVLAHPERVRSEILAKGSKFKEEGLNDIVPRFLETADRFAEKLSRGGDTEKQAEKFEREKRTLHEAIQAKIVKYRKSFDGLWDEPNSVAEKTRVQVLDILGVWCRIDNALKLGWGPPDIGRLPSDERELAYAVREFNSDYRSWRSAVNSLKSSATSAKNLYQIEWTRLLNRLKHDERVAEVLLSPEILAEFGLNGSDELVDSATGKLNRDALMRELKIRKAAVIPGIVRALAAGCDRTSVIDGQYNSTKLNLFRTYYRLQNHSDQEIKELEKELLALEAEYTELVDHAEF